MWSGFFILKVDNTLTAPQLVQVKNAIEELGNQASDPKSDKPNILTHVIVAPDNRAIWGHIILTKEITREQVEIALASKLGVNEATVSSKITEFQVFSGANLEDRRIARDTYLKINAEYWGLNAV